MKLVPFDERSWPALCQRIAARITWTSYDFIREPELFGRLERQDLTNQWTRAVEPTNAFCYEDVVNEIVVLAERLEWDSAFFGYDIVRLNSVVYDNENHPDLVPVLQAWLALLSQRGIRYVMSVVFPEDLCLVQALGQCGFELIESRITFHQKIADFTPKERYDIRKATDQDVDYLSAVAREMVNPFDRFHADRFINRKDADRLMSEWVRASIEGSFADFAIVPDVPKPQAFCTVKSHQEKWHLWGVNLAQSVVLGAVAPSFKGWYRKLISESNIMLASMGAEHVFWKTQITNRAAIRTAEKLDYRFGRCEFVFRMLL